MTTWERVPKGTNGGVTFIGTLCSTIGGLVVGLAQYLALIYFSDSVTLQYAPPQWPLILFGALAGFLGSLIDSYMGAILQYSGKYDESYLKQQSHEAGSCHFLSFTLNFLSSRRPCHTHEAPVVKMRVEDSSWRL